MAVVDGLDLGSVGNFIDHVLQELAAGHEKRLRDAQAKLGDFEASGKPLDPARHEHQHTKIEKEIETLASEAYESKTALEDIEVLHALMRRNPKDAALHKAIYLMMFVAARAATA